MLTAVGIVTTVLATAGTTGGISEESNSTKHVRSIKSPNGGIMQFKGLTQGTTTND